MHTMVNSQRHSKHQSLPYGKGFTLIEIMVVVAIIGILSSIALPAYNDYVTKGKAAEATATLADLRVRMEQYFQDNRTYVGADLLPAPGPCVPAIGSTRYFSYACNVAPTTYNITATGVAAQGMDPAKFSYTINQNNAKSSVYEGVVGATCWLTGKGATC